MLGEDSAVAGALDFSTILPWADRSKLIDRFCTTNVSGRVDGQSPAVSADSNGQAVQPDLCQSQAGVGQITVNPLGSGSYGRPIIITIVVALFAVCAAVVSCCYKRNLFKSQRKLKHSMIHPVCKYRVNFYIAVQGPGSGWWADSVFLVWSSLPSCWRHIMNRRCVLKDSWSPLIYRGILDRAV